MQKASDAAGARPSRSVFARRASTRPTYARAVARISAPSIPSWIVSARDARAVIPNCRGCMTSHSRTPRRSRPIWCPELARRHVTVALSGDGGDELFGGYNRYGTGYRVFSALHHLPRSLRGSLGRAMSAISPAQWDGALSSMPASLRPRHAGEKLHKLAAVLPEDTQGYYERLASPGGDFWRALPGAAEPTLGALALESRQAIPDARAWMQFMDAATYLPDDILTKVDRASMAVASGAAFPFSTTELSNSRGRCRAASSFPKWPRPSGCSGKS